MVILAAGLFAVSIAGFVWFILYRRQTEKLLAVRISTVAGGLSFPFPIASLTGTGIPDPISLDDIKKDKVARDLFYAGFHKKKSILLLRAARKISLAIPLAVLAFNLMQGIPVDLQKIGFWLLFGLFLFCLTHFILFTRREKRVRAIMRTLPQFMDLLTVCVEAGLNFTAALPRVIKESDPHNPLIQEFEQMHREFLSGLPLSVACDRMSRRCNIPDLTVILNTIVESEQLGTSLADGLRIQAADLRDKLKQRVREKALKIPVKLVFPSGLIFITLFAVSLGPVVHKLAKTISALGDPRGTTVK